MRRVLIVSPHFPPVNAADHHRVRMSLPYYQEFGWQPTILAVRADCVEGGTIDPLLEATLPAELTVIRSGAIPARATRLIGLGSLAIRALPNLLHAGNRLLREAKRRRRQPGYDLVYFSTTQFPVMILGPHWKRKFDIPYVVDFQDPWLDDYYQTVGALPPGGNLKYGVSHQLARFLEPKVMREVSEVISVSPAYVRTLRVRYPHLKPAQFTVIPFGALERDFEMLDKLAVRQSVFDHSDGQQHWLYIGRGGPDMAPALHLFFSALQAARASNPDDWRCAKVHFVGTSYAPEGRAQKTVQPIADAFGLSNLVEERTNRLPYFDTLQALIEADALVVIGSDSPSYSASKLYPYMLARKPMVSVLHEQSPAVEILRRCNGGQIVTFNPENLHASSSAMTIALRQTQLAVETGTAPDLTRGELNRLSACELTRQQCEVFDRAVVAKPNTVERS